MPPKSKTTLTDSQKYELCLYARDNKKSRVKSLKNFIFLSWRVFCQFLRKILFRRRRWQHWNSCYQCQYDITRLGNCTSIVTTRKCK